MTDIVMGNVAGFREENVRLRSELEKYKTLAAVRGRDLSALEPRISEIADGLDDEGDRVYLNSTNDADALRDLAEELQGTNWEVMEPTLEPDYPRLNGELRAECAALKVQTQTAEQRGYERGVREAAGLVSDVWDFNPKQRILSLIPQQEGE